MDIYQIEYFKCFLIILGTVAFIYILCTKKKIINLDKVYPSKRGFVKKHFEMFNNIAKIGLIILVIASIFFIIIPGFKDLKDYISGDFKVANCKILTGDSDKTIYKRRHINVINVNTGEILELDVGYIPIYKDQYYTIKYLPNMKIGEIIE